MSSLRFDFSAAPAVITVSDLNRRVRHLLENQLEVLWVSGELSNVKTAPSGHWYFCLKDRGAQVECAMFQSRARFLDFRPENGLQVEVRARVSLYEPRGTYQLVVEEIRQAGLGRLYEAFEKLKAKLQAEGLFEAERKRSLPAFPCAIGLVTSPSAAALRDVITTLRRRAPMIPIVLYPTQVQGDGAAGQIVRAIERANRHSYCEVLIVCRGGGSLEDLWAYNEEIVARAIVASRLPIVSGVGHETDFSIADFVADLRAATPTAAAAAVSPDREALCGEVAAIRRRLARDLRRLLERGMQRLDSARHRLLTPAERLERDRRENARLAQRLRSAFSRNHQQKAARLAALRDALAHLDPTQVLGRGYSIVRGPDGHVLRSTAGLEKGSAIEVTFSEGAADAEVKRVR